MAKDELPLLSALMDISGGSVSDHARSAPWETIQTSISTILRATFATLKPSFLTRRIGAKPRKIHPTSYLDGLRGVAALFVVINHYVSQFWPHMSFGYGSPGHVRFLQLPILRTFYSGRWMVTIFFVISGYVLSHRALGLARQKQYAALLKSLSSSVFRRWLRLMLPAIASTFIAFLLVRANWATPLYQGWDAFPPSEQTTDIAGGFLPERMNSTASQFAHWLESCKNMTDPFRNGPLTFPVYNVPLWTMGVEYMGSMLVFVSVLGLAQTGQTIRMGTIMLLALYCLWFNRHMLTLFFSGIVLAERAHIVNDAGSSISQLDVQIQDDNEKASIRRPSRRRLKQNVLPLAACLVAMYLGTFPEFDATLSPGYRTLEKLQFPAYKTSNMFWPTLGAILLVYTLESAKFLQEVFTTPFAQYLGDISVSIYMMHCLVELSLVDWLVPKCLKITSGWTNGGFGAGMIRKCLCVSHVIRKLTSVQ